MFDCFSGADEIKIRSQLALEILVLAQPAFHVLAVPSNPVDLGADGVETLLDGTVVALHRK